MDMSNTNAETVKLGVPDATQPSLFEKELRDAIARRKGKAPVFPQQEVERFVTDSVKLRFEPGCIQATKLLDRIRNKRLYLLSDASLGQFAARLSPQIEDPLGEQPADAGTQADTTAGAEASDSPVVEQTDRVGQDVTTGDEDERGTAENEDPGSHLGVKSGHGAKIKAKHTRPSAPTNEQRSKLGALAANTSEAVVTNGEEAPPLSKAERKQLNRYEKTIAKGRDAMLKACKALKAIRDQRLYREKFDTFEDYCLKKWNLARSSAYQRLTLAQAHETLSATADKPVEVNERQARALGGLSDEDMVRVWKQAVKASNTQNPSTKNIKAARKELNLAPVKSGAGKPNPKSSGEANQVTTPASSQGEFDPGSRWQTFRDQVTREYEGWPQAHRVAFRDNLRAWLKEQEDGDNEAQNLASEAA